MRRKPISLNPHHKTKKRIIDPARTLMGQRCPTLPDPTPKGFIFSAEEYKRPLTADQCAVLFGRRNTLNAGQAATAP